MQTNSERHHQKGQRGMTRVKILLAAATMLFGGLAVAAPPTIDLHAKPGKAPGTIEVSVVLHGNGNKVTALTLQFSSSTTGGKVTLPKHHPEQFTPGVKEWGDVTY